MVPWRRSSPLARWQSGHAAACKAVYAGSIPTLASRTLPRSVPAVPVTLKRWREKRNEARRLIADGIDPSARRKAEQGARAETFEAVAREWIELQSKALASETVSILG